MSKNIKCIIVEDEPLAVKILSGYIAEISWIDLQGTFKDALLAIDYLRDNHIDLIFLDIHLPKLKGNTFLKTLINSPAVIMTTAYHQYAVEGFELNVADYLLKPIEFDRFLAAVNKVKPPVILSDHIFLNFQRKKIKIAFSEILYIESQREYVRVVTSNAEYLTKMSTNEIEALLPPTLFRRVHRSFIVSLDKIASFTAEIITVGQATIPIGRDYRDILGTLK